MKITSRNVDTIQLLPGQKERLVRDDEISGFALRIRAGGSRKLYFNRMPLCDAVPEAFPAVRERAAELQLQISAGRDPLAEKRAAAATAQRQQAESFKAAADLYLAKQIKRVKPRSYREEQHNLMVKAKSLHTLPLVKITRREIALVLNETESNVRRGNGAATVNKLRAHIGMLFNWAMREGLCESNPTVATNQRDQAPRSRVLSIEELVQIWRALPDDNFGVVMKLLMLTALRRTEVGALMWNEVHLDKSQIILPATRTKNGHEHVVPLSKPAHDLLARQHAVVGWPTIFSHSAGGMSGWGEWKRQLDAKLPHLAHWTIHDLRRSAATHMGEQLGVLPHVVEAILNHQSGSKGGVAGIYNRAMYLKEKTAALALWSEHLMAAVGASPYRDFKETRKGQEAQGGPAKVVPIRAA